MREKSDNSQKIMGVKENLKRANQYKSTKQILESYNATTAKESEQPQGITRRQFHRILDKASRPIKKPKSDSESS